MAGCIPAHSLLTRSWKCWPVSERNVRDLRLSHGCYLIFRVCGKCSTGKELLMLQRIIEPLFLDCLKMKMISLPFFVALVTVYQSTRRTTPRRLKFRGNTLKSPKPPSCKLFKTCLISWKQIKNFFDQDPNIWIVVKSCFSFIWCVQYCFLR